MSENPDSTDTPKATSGTSEADADHSGGTTSPASETIGGVSDDQLPEDLQPGEDNPLAEPLDPDAEDTKSREDLEMDATQEDLGNAPVESPDEEAGTSDGPGEADSQSGGGANSGEGAQGDGLAEG